jgi:Mor family transcriptional regulator
MSHSGIQELYAVPPRGLDHTAVPHLVDATQILLAVLYSPDTYVPVPPPENIPKTERNAEICRLYVQGWSVPHLSEKCGVSKTRIYQILKVAGVTRGR